MDTWPELQAALGNWPDTTMLVQVHQHDDVDVIKQAAQQEVYELTDTWQKRENMRVALQFEDRT